MMKGEPRTKKRGQVSLLGKREAQGALDVMQCGFPSQPSDSCYPSAGFSFLFLLPLISGCFLSIHCTYKHKNISHKNHMALCELVTHLLVWLFVGIKNFQFFFLQRAKCMDIC